IRRIERHAPERRLEAEEAAMRRRQAHRAADVGAEMKRRIAGDGGRGGAGARSRRVAVEPPGIARDAVEARDARGEHAVVGHGGLAEDHAARLARARRRRRIAAFGRRIEVRARADRRRIAFRMEVLLDGDRHAVERRARRTGAPARFRVERLRERAVGIDAVHRVDLRLPRCDALQQRPGDVHRRQLARLVGRKELLRREFVNSGHRRRTIYSPPMLKKVLLAVAFLCAASPALAAKELELWHAMRGPSADEMGRLVEQFNASQSEFRVVATYKGSYEETLAAALAAHKAGKGPDRLQVYDAGTADLMAGKDVVRPLWQVMSESGHAVDAKYLPAVAGYYSDEKGRLLALPLSTATPVLYYNRDAFKRAQLDPDKAPKTWYEIPKTLGALRESGVSCPMTTAWPSWVLFENMTAWHNEEFATHHNGMDGHGARLSFNGRLMVRWISMLSSWMKAGYFEYSGRAAEGEARFVSGECAVLTSSSASYGELRENAKFDLGVAQLPYYDDIGGAPHNTLTGGAALWVMGGKPKPDYHGIAK